VRPGILSAADASTSTAPSANGAWRPALRSRSAGSGTRHSAAATMISARVTPRALQSLTDRRRLVH